MLNKYFLGITPMPGFVVYTFNSNTLERDKTDSYEFKPSVVSIVNSRPDRPIT